MLPSTKPRIELHGDYFYMIMHFPALRHSHSTREQEVDFVFGRNFLITAHYDTIDALHKFSKIFEVNSVLGKNSIGNHAGFLLFFMLRKMYKAVEHEVDYIRQELVRIESDIFAGYEVSMVEHISKNARDLMNLRQTIEPHREVLQDFEQLTPHFYGQEFEAYAKAVSHEYYRVHNHVMRNTETLHELRETNNSLLTTKQNETMRVLTTIALLTFPLTLFVSMFDVNSKSNPVINSPYGFWIIVGTVIVTGGLMLWYFRHKKWL